VGGVFAAKELFVPTVYKPLLGGPRLMVDFNRGVIAELFLTFLMTFSVLVAVFRGPSNAFLKTWMIILATYAVILLGAGYTGPSLNPAHVRTPSSPCDLFIEASTMYCVVVFLVCW
jgi:aquaporin SIP